MQYNKVCFTSFLLISTELYGLEITNNGPITTGAQATVQASLRMENKNVTSNLYHFNWIYAPLILIEKSEQRFTSIINVTGEFPGTFPISVWVTHKNCWLCRPVARNITVLQITEDSRVTTHGSRSSPDTVTRISFSLHDPSHYFQSASFVYNWDFGDGVYQITKEPFVYCNCSSVGNRTVHLKVVAEWEQTGSIIHEREIMQKTGDFTTALELLGNYETSLGSRETQVMENLNLSLHINGTPPLALCWLIKSECIPLEGDKCHLVEISGSCYNLSHTFRDAGQYCLSVRVENGVTMLQTYHGIKVRPNGGQPGCDTGWSHRVTVSQLCTDRAAHSRRHWCAFRAESSVLEALSCCGGESPSCPLGVPQRYKQPGESRADICNWVEVFRLFKRKEGIKGKTLTTPSHS
uniref:Transmembrane protein 130 n=1 Tax=Corvus moneduloides TaxID=1196302 RepID=A0A8C3DWD6_CORMO